MAKGSHCQATIRMIGEQRASVNQSIGVRPSEVAIQAKRPDTGCIRRFFQTSALTVGMTKNGAITISRTMLRPITGWSISSASRTPSTIVMRQHRSDQISVFDRARKAGSVRK